MAFDINNADITIEIGPLTLHLRPKGDTLEQLKTKRDRLILEAAQLEQQMKEINEQR